MKNIMDYFKEISAIPRGSRNEAEISQYVIDFATKRNYQYASDELGNVVVYKPASKGYEDHPVVMLQAHMDMVCEKNKDVEFDFEHDPLMLYEEDGWLKAKGTTLGADDGYGVSYMLAVLNNPDLVHPPLECLFTVQEEIGLVGARALKADYFHAKKLITMDSGGEYIVTVSSSGGRRNKVRKEMKRCAVNEHTFHLGIRGLLGGHSGGVINKERGSAIKLTARMMMALLEEMPIHIVSINGGLKENAIARECDVTFTCDSSIKYIDHIFKSMAAKIKDELHASDPDFYYTLEQVDAVLQAYDEESSKQLIELLYLMPQGMYHHSMEIPGLVTASTNIGSIAMDGDTAVITSAIRSPLDGYRNDIALQIKTIASLLDAASEDMADYPGWSYEKDSPLRKLYNEVIEEKLGKTLEERASHGGLEAGVLKGLLPELDIITLGPIASGAHTPDEQLNIASFERMYEVLTYLLTKL